MWLKKIASFWIVKHKTDTCHWNKDWGLEQECQLYEWMSDVRQ
jgi:hypothetical protein